ncbi:MAG TPA: ATP-binding cassette domain-containing protein [Acidobacteriaceae bacterium]|jgi:phospholipid/cholesterol/gamma-HCH transport system ATP-binding protein
MSETQTSSGAATLELPEGVPVVEFKDVSIRFDVKPVLHKISFAVERGQTLILLGPAGCGKSVLLKLANGLLRPDEGSIRIFGQEITTMRDRDLYAMRAHIGMVFQESALFDSLNVEDNVAYRLHEEHVPEDESHARVVEALKFVELEQAIAKFPSELSGGMRRRVSIARAIISGPDLILYDSPTGGLDPITSTTIIELVMKQRDVSHTTSLLVTHRLQDAFTLATHRYDAAKGMAPISKDGPERGIDDSTKFLMLNEGNVVFHGTTEELVRSTDPWIKEYLE